MTGQLIKKLSDIAWGYANDNSRDGDARHGLLYTSKLSELILAKCLKQCDLVKNEEPLKGVNPRFSDGVSSGANRVKLYIVKEFGIDPKSFMRASNTGAVNV